MKPEKNQIFTRERQFLPVKKLKKRQKNAREKQKLPVKKLEKRPKMAFTGNFFFHGGNKKRWLIAGIKESFEGNSL